MAYEKIKRNQYYDPPSEYPHSSRNHAEDQQEFHLPMDRMHNSNLHDWGVASGLEVNGTIGGTEIIINSGAAVDGDGQLISLSNTGHGDIGANPPGGQHNEVTVPVHLSTGSHAGQTVYLTIQFSEILRPAEGSGGRMEQVPWLRLQPVSGTGAYADDGTAIILAILEINSSGNLAALKAVDSTIPYRRRLIGQTIEELRIQRSKKTGDTVDEVESGKIKPSDGGGLKITVPNNGDGISFVKEDGGNFSNLEARANNIVVKDSAGRDALKFETDYAWLTIGANGNEGDLRINDGSGRLVLNFNGDSAALTIGTNGNEGNLKIKDSSGRQVLNFDGDSAALYIGTNGNEGDLIVKDNSGNDSAKIDGNTGTIKMKKIEPYGNALDIDARYVRVHGWDLMLDGRSGGNKRALVDNNNRLVLNWANDYANGVDINKLHLSDHIRVGFWEERSEWNPGRYEWHTFYERDIGLKASEWNYVTMCEIGMYDKGTVKHFWWQTDNVSHTSTNGNIVIKWNIEYGDNGTDWMPYHRAVCWIAYRR